MFSPHQFPPVDPDPDRDDWRHDRKSKREEKGCDHCKWMPWETTAWLVWGFTIFVVLMAIMAGTAGTYTPPTCGERIANAGSRSGGTHIAGPKDNCVQPTNSGRSAPVK
jgi:hypothetical protein